MDSAPPSLILARALPTGSASRRVNTGEVSSKRGQLKGSSMAKVTVIDHPMIQHKLTIMRDKETSIAGFRRLLREIAHLMCYEVTRDLELEMIPVDTPLTTMQAPTIKGKKLVFASLLRAGNGLLDGMLALVPAARVAHIGIYRDHETLQPVEYYFKAPAGLGSRLIIVVGPMYGTK